MIGLRLADGVDFLAAEDGTVVLVDELAVLLSIVAGAAVQELDKSGSLTSSELERIMTDQFGAPVDAQAFESLISTLVNSRIIVRF